MTRKPTSLARHRESPSFRIGTRSPGAFARLAGLPWAAWLDSAAADSHERFDILVADPYVTLRTRGATTEIARRGGAATQSRRSPFELVREQLGELDARGSRPAVLRRSRRLLRLRLGQAARTHPVDRGGRHRDAGSRGRALRLGRRRRSRRAPHVARRSTAATSARSRAGRARRAPVGRAAAGARAVSRARPPEVEPRPRARMRPRSAPCRSTFAAAIAIR